MPIEQIIVTARPSGTGFNAKGGDGYQLAAASPGIAEPLRSAVERRCYHLGSYFERMKNLMPDAIGELDKWDSATRDVPKETNPVPDNVLDAFPVIWDYCRIGEDMFAMIRVGYTGRQPYGAYRLGNYLAHALVFPPEALTACRFNPMALARTALFKSRDDGRTTTLETPGALPDAGSAGNGWGMLNHPPCKAQLEGLVTAVVDACAKNSRLVVCIPDWRNAAGMAEELLALVPPSVRCRMPVCAFMTGETASFRFNPVGTAPTTENTAPAIGVVCGKEALQSMKFGDYVYLPESDQKVFNFIDPRKIGKMHSPGAYAQLAVCAAARGNDSELQRHHKVIAALNAGLKAEAWDGLTPAAELLNPSADANAVAEGIRSAAAVAQDSRSAQTVLEWVQTHVERYAKAGNADALACLGKEAVVLADRIDPSPVPAFAALIDRLFEEAMRLGRGRVARELRAMLGRHADPIVLQWAKRWIGKPAPPFAAPPDADDRQCLLDLVIDSAGLASKTGEKRLDRQLLAEAFRMARDFSLVERAWAATASIVDAELEGERTAEKESLLTDLLASIGPKESPDAYVRLMLRQMELGCLREDMLLETVADVARAIASTAAADPFAARLLKFIEQLKDSERAALALAWIVEAAGDPLSRRFFDAYQKAMQVMPDKEAFNLRQKLAKGGTVEALARELLAEILPWEEEKGRTLLADWKLIVSIPAMKERLQQKIAALLGGAKPRDRQGILGFAETLIPAQTDKPIDARKEADPAQAAFYEAVVLALPLAPLEDQWRRLERPDLLLPAVACSRLRVLTLMRQIEEKAENNQNWSVLDFLPLADQVWKTDVRAMNDPQKAEVLDWCLDTFHGTGIVDPRQVQELVTILNSVGEDSCRAIGPAVKRLAGNRSDVAIVNLATAFADCAMARDGRQLEDYASCLKSIVETMNRAQRGLLEDHFCEDRRFCVRGKKHLEKLAQVCMLAGLKPPSALVKMGGARRRGDESGAEFSMGGKLTAKITTFLRGIFQKSDDPKKGPH